MTKPSKEVEKIEQLLADPWQSILRNFGSKPMKNTGQHTQITSRCHISSYKRF